MSSAARKAIVPAKAALEGGTTTSAAGWGKVLTYNFGVAWRRANLLSEPNPVGMLLRNPQQLGFGYGEGVAVLADGKTEVWGQNNGANLPWTVGPEGFWCGTWEYRTNLGSQAALEPGLTRAQIEAKERALEIAPRADGRKGLPGQVVHVAGHVVIEEGQSWEALRETCGIKPGTDPTVWRLTSPQVVQFRRPTKEEGEVWFPYAFNLGMPVRAPQLTNVLAVALIGTHGIALLRDGTIREWGHMNRYGGFGVDYNGSWGPKPRPLKPPPSKTNKFHGRMVAGSKWIDMLENIGEKHHKVSPATTSYGQATKVGSSIIMPEGVTGVIPPGTTIAAAETEELLEGGKPFSPARVKVLRIEMSAAALANYGPGGQILVKKPPKESQFWPQTEGPLQSAGWPVKPKLPPGVTVTAIAAGANGSYPISLALTDEGKVLAWGSNSNGSMGNGGAVGKEHFNLVPEYVKDPTGAGLLENIVSIACGETFCMAINSSRQVFIWGSVDKGLGGKALDEAGESHSNLPVLVPGMPTAGGEKPVAIAGSNKTAFVTLENGKVLAWGSNEKGECGNGSVGGKASKPWKPGTAYSVGNKVYDRGFNYSCAAAVTSSTHPGEDGAHWAIESQPAQPVPDEVLGLSSVRYIAGGRFHAAAVTTAGLIFCWGDNTFGQIGNGKTGKLDKDPPHGTPFQVPLEGKKVLSCDLGEQNTIVIIDGATTVVNPVKVRLLPQGEVAGEQNAKLRLEWKSGLGTAGWQFKFRRQPTWWEEVELQALLEQLEAELEEAEEEGTKEEREELEEEIELIEQAQEEAEQAATNLTPFVPTEVSPGVLRYDWTPATPLTPNLGYVVSLARPGSEPASWKAVSLPTNGLWQSAYAFAA